MDNTETLTTLGTKDTEDDDKQCTNTQHRQLKRSTKH
jgi:hypothetical protein